MAPRSNHFIDLYLSTETPIITIKNSHIHHTVLSSTSVSANLNLTGNLLDGAATSALCTVGTVTVNLTGTGNFHKRQRGLVRRYFRNASRSRLRRKYVRNGPHIRGRNSPWIRAISRYLMGLYYGTWPWLRQFVNVDRLGLSAVKLWAYDHLCLFGWPVPPPVTDDRSSIY